MRSDDVLAMLRRHYLPEGRPPAGMFADEIASPCGTRRADLIWVPIVVSQNHGSRLVGHEIKVSRADVLTELADQAKHDPWARYCDRWWLVVSDPAFLDGLDIPDAWGVMSPPSGRRTRTMTVLRPAPPLNPQASGPALTRLASFAVNRVETQVAAAQREVRYAKQEAERAQAQARAAADRSLGAQSPDAARIGKLLRLIDNAAAKTWKTVSDEDIAAAVLDVTMARLEAESIRRTLREVVSLTERIVEPFRDTRSNLDSARKRLETALDGGIGSTSVWSE